MAYTPVFAIFRPSFRPVDRREVLPIHALAKAVEPIEYVYTVFMSFPSQAGNHAFPHE
jgi:hypothetical protein